MDSLQKMRSELVTKQIETQAFVDQSVLNEISETQYGQQMKSIQSGIEDMQRKADVSDTEAQQIQAKIDEIKG